MSRRKINLEIIFDFIGYALIQIPDVLISFYDRHQEKLRKRDVSKSGCHRYKDRALPINRGNRNASITNSIPANELVINANPTIPKELDNLRMHIVELSMQLQLLNNRVDEIQKNLIENKSSFK